MRPGRCGLLNLRAESFGVEEGFGFGALGKVRISFQAEQERGSSVGSPLDPSLLFQVQLLPGQLETCLTQVRVVHVQPTFR